jgi:hypothetical protein
LIKLPNLIACAAGFPLCWYGLRGIWGEARARQAAWSWALCIPLWYNAGPWGQADVLLALGLAAAVIAALHGRPAWVGVALGLAFSLKLMAIVVVPVLAVFLFRKQGARALAAATAAGVATLFVVIAPFIFTGQSEGVIASYSNAVGMIAYRAVSALNGWFVLDWFDVNLRHLPSDWTHRPARLSTRPFLGSITYRAFSLALFAAAAAFSSAGLWRRPTSQNLAFTSALIVFAFFTLTTEMHERYIVPAAGLMTLVAAENRNTRWFSVALSGCALLNQVLRGTFTGAFGQSFDRWQAFVNGKLLLDVITSVATCALFIVGMQLAWRACFREESAAEENVGNVEGADPCVT